MNRRIKCAHALIGATALCCLLVPIAVAASAGGSGGPEATASSVQKRVKKLTKRVRKLELQVGGLGKQQGPPGQEATKLFAYISDDTSAVTANVHGALGPSVM